MSIPFTKMNSQGNDFIVIDNSRSQFIIDQKTAIRLCDRNNVGCDQLLILKIQSASNVECIIYNNDGTKASQCGNGLRAIMLFLHSNYQYTEVKIYVEGISYCAKYIDNELIEIKMGTPYYVYDVPNLRHDDIKILKNQYYFDVKSTFENQHINFTYGALSIGNLHCVIFSEGSYEFREEISSIIKVLYADMANISFILNPKELINGTQAIVSLRVNERGAGWTQSCGSGATAAGCFALKHLVPYDKTIIDKKHIKVRQEGGLLEILLDADEVNDMETLFLSGPSEIDYVGSWDG